MMRTENLKMFSFPLYTIFQIIWIDARCITDDLNGSTYFPSFGKQLEAMLMTHRNVI